MSVFLPLVAASVVKVAAKDEGRYAMAGVRVLDPGDGTYRLEATDGKRAVILRGYSLDADRVDASLVPAMPPLDEAPASEGIIPTADWVEGFKMVPKEKGYNRKDYPLGIDMGKQGYVMATHGAQRQGRLLEGRFPDFASVLPGKPAKVSFTVNPALMIELLRAAQAVLGDEQKVVVHFWTESAPVGITCNTGDHGGVFFDGLIMPLT